MQKAFDGEVALNVGLGSEASEELCRPFLAKNGARGWMRRLRVNAEVESVETLRSVDNSCTLPGPRLRVGPAVKQMVTNGRLEELKIVMGPDPKRNFDSWSLTLGVFLQSALGFRLKCLSQLSLESLRIWTVFQEHIRARGLCDHHAAKPGGCGEGSDQETLEIETEPVGSAYAGDYLLEVDWRPMYGVQPRRAGDRIDTQK